MPIFPPVTDTLRWGDLVRHGRAQLPLVAPDWTDQNTSDPGIALLELVSWLVEADSYRSNAVSERERRLLLALAGGRPRPARAARCLIRVQAAAPRLVPAGLEMDGERDGEHVPLTLVDDIAVVGATIAATAWAGEDAATGGYVTGCIDLTRERAAGRVFAPFGVDPSAGDCFVIGIDRAGGLLAGPLDLWAVVGGDRAPEIVEPGYDHHTAAVAWEAWDGADWIAVDADDRTAALTRSGRVRLHTPALPVGTLGDQGSGIFAGRMMVWLRCRLVSGRLDAPAVLSELHVDVGEAVASRRYRAAGKPADDHAPLAAATGVPDETLRLPHDWCGARPALALATGEQIHVVDDLADAGARLLAAVFEADGRTVRFGDGRWGARLSPGAEVQVSGTWTTAAGVADLRPPLAPVVPAADAAALLAGGPAVHRLDLVAGLTPGAPAEDIAAAAARVEARMWVHERISDRAQDLGVASLDDLPLALVRTLGVPERAITGLDAERIALATPGVALARARALPQVDPRMPGLVADGCVTVVVVPWLPAERPEPTTGALRRVRGALERARTVGTRFFVVGPTYVPIGISATILPRRGVAAADAVEKATRALRAFLHPVTGGPASRGWPFGRTVRRTEILAVVDEQPGVERMEDLVLTREGARGDAVCGDIRLCATEFALAGTLRLTAPTEGVGA
ncbi:baseplate J/gp47 family protein [Microbacterium terricola]|uniref:Baseplate assembly protein n=1 Tax=Microbacterium terricola TaxID=344163 RepID=A0ABM8E176_9MICO|nr:baseplate J/gp47 family protein [Microbacterium terricola]UYK40721.1 baseplate J/gp47 family protein [Microbacterium terricola]BDV31542.1 putative baseplate assembly protein [Microbacterium terricola]